MNAIANRSGRPCSRASAWLVFALALVGCTGGSHEDDGSSGRDDAGDDGRDGGGSLLTCNAIANVAPEIVEHEVAAELPIGHATGGAIALGTYFLTEITLFTGAGGETGSTHNRRKQTLVLAPDGSFDASVSSVRVSNGGAMQRRSYYVTSDGATLEILEVCPHAGETTTAFTATPMTLTVYDTTSRRVEVFTRQTCGDAEGG